METVINFCLNSIVQIRNRNDHSDMARGQEAAYRRVLAAIGQSFADEKQRHESFSALAAKLIDTVETSVEINKRAADLKAKG